MLNQLLFSHKNKAYCPSQDIGQGRKLGEREVEEGKWSRRTMRRRSMGGLWRRGKLKGFVVVAEK